MDITPRYSQTKFASITASLESIAALHRADRGFNATVSPPSCPPSRLRSSGIVIEDRQVIIRDERGRVLHDLPFASIRRFGVRRGGKIGALPFIAAGLLGMIGTWFWLNGLWAGLAGLTGLLMFVGGLTVVYPWQLEIETNDETLVQRELIGTTTTALFAENVRTRL